MTSLHDIISEGECSVECRCGRVFVRSSLEKAHEAHANHFGLELLRSALPQSDDAA